MDNTPLVEVKTPLEVMDGYEWYDVLTVHPLSNNQIANGGVNVMISLPPNVMDDWN